SECDGTLRRSDAYRSDGAAEERFNDGRAAGIVAEEPGVDQCDHKPGHRSANGGPDRVVDGDARTIAGFHRTSNLAKSRRRFHERGAGLVDPIHEIREL